MMFGEGTCLLYVENYHKDEGLGTFIFDAFSGSCMQSIILSSISIFFLLVVVSVRGFYISKKWNPPKTILIALNVLAAFLAAVCLYLGINLTLGTGKTCSQFEKSGKSCRAVLGEGFFRGNTTIIYTKSYTKILIIIVSAWVLLILWGLYMVSESYNLWKNKYTDTDKGPVEGQQVVDAL
ncbi:hypothetical protein BC833DRAFT_605026 [Globomyces pollinis-pini]|nr:hypothetical protein BC833DRAFT_605026 [Globomyces pollinis-pini]